MIQSPQQIQVSRDGIVHDAIVAWRWTPDNRWTVSLECSEFDTVEAHEDDSFEALCAVRESLEPHGWLVGVVGAQIDVWPSGMARDQGGGQRAYRLAVEGVQGMVFTFEPVDPARTTTVGKQRAESERLHEEMRRRAQNS